MKKSFFVIFCMTLFVLAGCSNSLGERPEELEADLDQYPHWFFDDGFNGVFIIDSNAEPADHENVRLMIEQLQQYDPSIDESLIKLYPAYSQLTGQNAILIGSCSQVPPNRWSNLFLDCVSMLPEQALVKIVDFKGAWLLFILGYDTDRTRDAIDMLGDYRSYLLQGDTVEVVREGDSYRVGLPR